jgi:hypothetical protein
MRGGYGLWNLDPIMTRHILLLLAAGAVCGVLVYAVWCKLRRPARG